MIFAILMAWGSVPSAGEGIQIFTPHSSLLKQEDRGKRVRTFLRISVPPGGRFPSDEDTSGASTHSSLTPHTAFQGPMGTEPVNLVYAFQTPASLACIYKLTETYRHCSPENSNLANPKGGIHAIAIVDAYDYPNALSDLRHFAYSFDLPLPSLNQTDPADRNSLSIIIAPNESGQAPTPARDPFGWELEAALDLQWAHGMAPLASLALVEAQSNQDVDMLAAVRLAAQWVRRQGGGIVSMSWGGDEWTDELAYDSTFKEPGVVFVAASGDSAGTSWPCVSSNVVCAGGTTLRLNPSSGSLIQEVPWNNAGGGISAYVPKPSYQKPVTGLKTGYRGVPDVALAADPGSGGWIFYAHYWWIVGGTSWSSPTLAGIISSAGTLGMNSSSISELNKLYKNYYNGHAAWYKDIRAGWCGFYSGVHATPKWDQCTGVGSLAGLRGW